MSNRLKLYLILALVLVVAVLSLPREDRVLRALGIKNSNLKVRQGLDLQGGVSLTYQADLSKTSAADRQKAVDGVINVIKRRVNPTGTSEVVVQLNGNDRLQVQLPGVNDSADAINLIGKTAQLTFLEANAQNQLTPSDVTGDDLASANPDFDPQSGQPVISFTMKAGKSTEKFSSLTTRINQAGTRLVILLDSQQLFNGTVSSPITDGRGQMTGFSDIKVARQTAVLLNAGALPVPIKLVEQRSVGASLGNESISKSLVAGLIGLLAVVIFMIGYYRLAGVIATVALIIYTLINITIFKLSGLTPAPIVMSLAGIAGFVLSIGMAVDANILIFERTREEVRDGNELGPAVEAGFKRAWNSIRDSNISTLITCLILYHFGSTLIKGFALTLAVGVLLSMFTAIIISRTLLRAIVQTKLGGKPSLYGFSERKANP